MMALPTWLAVLLLPWFSWLDVIVPRQRVLLASSIGAFALLAALRSWAGIPNGDHELDWGEVGLLSVGHIWAPLLVVTILYPIYLVGVVVLWLVFLFEQRRRSVDRTE
jgi:hypothetical protein